MRYLNFKLFVAFITFLSVSSCVNSESRIEKISVTQIPIHSEIPKDSVIEAIIAPYREHVNTVLDTPLSYAPELFTKKEGTLNTNIGNLMADIVKYQADSLLLHQGEAGVDLALLNFGGIRNVISKGPVTERTAYEVMPFENTIVALNLTGEPLREMIAYLVTQKVAHPISGLVIELKQDGSLNKVRINQQPIDFDKSYRVATSNFLLGGGDGMNFFKSGTDVKETGYLIRNAMTDYFRKTDTLKTKIDQRFYKIHSK